ncbi:MAG TPA: hypothetical protein VHX90_08705 [Verrucomicrobiae bacterium]|nr:hypothetical protein [Verrucomicrobiae bacterium]
MAVVCIRAPAQFSTAETDSTHSTSGQFIVTGGRQISLLARMPSVANNASLVRLEPALLAVSAERLKESLRRRLGIGQSAPWSGKIFLALHPARSTGENVTVISTHFGNGWDYRVELPDVVSRTRLTRALTGVLLLEFANRTAQSRSAEIPAWLTDGLSQQLSAAGSPENILSLPSKTVNDIPVARLTNDTSGIDDPLASARQILKNSPALTFEQLSWPDDNQISGADGGVYRASAQLFVSSLLALKDGPAQLCEMLQNLPRFYNWQTAFQNAFAENFSTPLDVEKWWALQVVGFAAREPDPMWTPEISRENLDGILSVPVEMRSASNTLPMRAEVSLQAVIRNFDSAQQAPILQTKLRDLELAQFHMAPPLSALADAYRRALSGYLEKDSDVSPAANFRNTRTPSKKSSAGETLKKLDALDAQRRTIEDAIKPGVSTPRNLNAPSP